MSKEVEVRRLLIKAFHIKEVKISENSNNYIKDNILYIALDNKDELVTKENKYVEKIEIKIIEFDKKDIFVNSIMDFSPIATKVLGKIGEGITHVLTGVCVMLTGVDNSGIQIAEFGSSEGILSEQVYFNRAGTPSSRDIIIHVDVTVKEGMGTDREAITEVHRLCDKFVQKIRLCLKNMNGRLCDERHEYVEKINPDKKRVVIIKQVAGQGAMYDTLLLSSEVGGVEGGRSIIDMGNLPLILSPNEYRDGALRAMH